MAFRAEDDPAGAARGCARPDRMRRRRLVRDRLHAVRVDSGVRRGRVEGFVPPSEDGLWPIDHDSLVDIAAHDPRMDAKVRGAMRMMEVGLAAAAPHALPTAWLRAT